MDRWMDGWMDRWMVEINGITVFFLRYDTLFYDEWKEKVIR